MENISNRVDCVTNFLVEMSEILKTAKASFNEFL